jgi:hypothetical protein
LVVPSFRKKRMRRLKLLLINERGSLGESVMDQQGEENELT